jgi:hypothetical protein
MVEGRLAIPAAELTAQRLSSRLSTLSPWAATASPSRRRTPPCSWTLKAGLQLGRGQWVGSRCVRARPAPRRTARALSNL